MALLTDGQSSRNWRTQQVLINVDPQATNGSSRDENFPKFNRYAKKSSHYCFVDHVLYYQFLLLKIRGVNSPNKALKECKLGYMQIYTMLRIAWRDTVTELPNLHIRCPVNKRPICMLLWAHDLAFRRGIFPPF